MKLKKRRPRGTHQVIVSPDTSHPDSEYKVFTLQVVFRNGRAVQISIQIMRSVVRLREMLSSGVELTRREIGFLAKYR